MGMRMGLRWLASTLVVALVAGGGTALAAGQDWTSPEHARILPADAIVSAADGQLAGDDDYRQTGVEDPLAGAAAIESYAREHLAGTFGGLYLADTADKGSTLIVAFTEAPSPEHEQKMRELAGPLAIDFRLVDYSLAELNEKQSEIGAQMQELEQQGVEIAYFGVDVMANRVTVAVTGDVHRAEEILFERFGGDMIEVVVGERPQLLPANGEAESQVSDVPQEAPGDVIQQSSSAGDANAGKVGFFQRILEWFRSLWSRLFN